MFERLRVKCALAELFLKSGAPHVCEGVIVPTVLADVELDLTEDPVRLVLVGAHVVNFKRLTLFKGVFGVDELLKFRFQLIQNSFLMSVIDTVDFLNILVFFLLVRLNRRVGLHRDIIVLFAFKSAALQGELVIRAVQM